MRVSGSKGFYRKRAPATTCNSICDRNEKNRLIASTRRRFLFAPRPCACKGQPAKKQRRRRWQRYFR
jgi:hypothetical protein